MLLKFRIFLSSFIESESSDFTGLFSLEGVVGVVLRSGSNKLEFAEIVANRN